MCLDKQLFTTEPRFRLRLRDGCRGEIRLGIRLHPVCSQTRSVTNTSSNCWLTVFRCWRLLRHQSSSRQAFDHGLKKGKTSPSTRLSAVTWLQWGTKNKTKQNSSSVTSSPALVSHSQPSDQSAQGLQPISDPSDGLQADYQHTHDQFCSRETFCFVSCGIFLNCWTLCCTEVQICPVLLVKPPKTSYISI